MRFDFLRKINTIFSPIDDVGIDIYDTLNVRWQDFPFVNGYRTYTITNQDAKKPWLVAYNNGIPYLYEDVLFLINGVRDQLNLVSGQVLKIPPLGDIQSFCNSIVQ